MGSFGIYFKKTSWLLGSKNARLYPKGVPGAAAVALKKVHHLMCNEKLGKVTDFGDPRLNIELAVL